MINKTAIDEKAKEKGYNQTEIGELLGIAGCTYGQKLTGYRPMKVSEANKLMELLGIKPEEYNYYFNI